MQRLKDYAGFGVWFLGLSYIVMWIIAGPLDWPLKSADVAASLCADGMLPALCVLAHPMALSPLVHLIGLMAAITVLVRLLLIALRSARQPAGGDGTPHEPSRHRRRPEPTVKRVKSRDHFGLRGLS